MSQPGARALDLRGALEAVDERGHRVAIAFEGRRIAVRFEGAGAALAAARSARALRANGLRWLIAALARHAPVAPDTLAVDFLIGDRRVGRAGRDAMPNWLGRALGVPWAELAPLALLAAVLRPRA